MKQCIRIGWLALAAFACAGLLGLGTTQAAQKEKGDDKGKEKAKEKGKQKVYEVGKDELKIEGKLTAEDKRDKVRANCYAKVYLVKLSDKNYTLRLNSPNQEALDPWLRVEDAEGKELESNDDDPDGGTLNSHIEFKAPKAGVYRIIATSFGDDQVGDFTLLIKAN